MFKIYASAKKLRQAVTGLGALSAPVSYIFLGALLITIAGTTWLSGISWPNLVSIVSACMAGAFLSSIMQQDRLPEAEKEVSDHINDLHWETDRKGRLISVEGRLLDIIRADRNQLIGKNFLDIISLEATEHVRLFEATKNLASYSDIQAKLSRQDGEDIYLSINAIPKYGAQGEVKGYKGVATNITNRVLKEQHLKQLAEKDMLTGLANRYQFNQRIERDLKTNQADQCLALFAIDLDGFKQVNDTHGHQAGDALLNLFGKRLSNHLRNDDWAARLGGDEFMVVSNHVKDPEEACLMAARLVQTLSQTYRIGGLEVTISASIGIACSPQHGSDPAQLIKLADLALYRAKANGRNGYCLYKAAELDIALIQPANVLH